MSFKSIYNDIPKVIRAGHARIDQGIRYADRLREAASEELAKQADSAIGAALDRKAAIDATARNIRKQIRALAALCYDGSIREPKDDNG